MAKGCGGIRFCPEKATTRAKALSPQRLTLEGPLFHGNADIHASSAVRYSMRLPYLVKIVRVTRNLQIADLDVTTRMLLPRSIRAL
jgi:hypothetical protein